MATEPALEQLVNALRALPGVGVKSAQRMAFHLLQHDRTGAQALARALDAAISGLQHCERCHTFTAQAICHTCADPQRDDRLLCVVETPADQAAIERTGSYRGRYFVLMGRVSPLDGVGASAIGLRQLVDRVADEAVDEVILATNFTAEGEATAYVMTEALRGAGATVTRLARGVPAGSELEHVDLSTIAHALARRQRQSP